MTPPVKQMITTGRTQDAAPGTGEKFNTGYIWAVSLAGALGGLLFGYDWVVIGGARPFYEKFFRLAEGSQQGWAMSCALIGCLIGALVSGALSDRYGRKRLLIVAAIVFALSSLGIAFANTFGMFVTWRMMGGLAIGIASSLSPVYIAELAPAALRGKLVSLNQLTIVIGILLAQVANWLIARPVAADATAQQILDSWNGQIGWRWMFGVTAIPSVLFFAAMFLVPESPRWLAKRGLHDAARRVLSRVGGQAYAERALVEIEATLSQDSQKFSLKPLFEKRVRKILALGVALAVLQQWCGINVIFNYAEEVFSAAGYRVSDILFNIVVTGAVNLLFTFVAIGTVDKLGRKSLLMTGSLGLAVIYALLGACYFFHSHGIHMLVLVVAAIGCYAMSLGPVTWVVISEVFPNRVRGAAMSVAVTALWLACFVLTYTFPLLNRSLGSSATFWIYAAICLAGYAFVKARLPETKGKTLEEIEDVWNR
jgi:SP family arabinose:H+ symporter-like MFS transporter